MTNKFIVLFLIACMNNLCAQTAPTIAWQRIYGVGWNEVSTSIIPSSDGGYIWTGITNFAPGSISDYWIMKIDAAGNKIWEKKYGGTGDDRPLSVIKTNDNNYVVVGRSNSYDGDVGNTLGERTWIIKLNNSGDIIWKKLIGLAGSITPHIYETPDGNLMLAGTYYNSSGNKNQAFVTKLSPLGDTLWTKYYGGSADDYGSDICKTLDGGFIVLGSTLSNDGDVTGNHGSRDIWLIKINNIGIIEWQKTFGGGGYESSLNIKQNIDGSLIFYGKTHSNDGDLLGLDPNPDSDYWIVKTTSLGNIIWQKKIGSINEEYDDVGNISFTNDGGILVIAKVYGNGKTVSNSNYHNGSELFLLKLSADGDIQWKRSYGGFANEGASTAFQNPDGTYIFAGSTNSTTGDLLGSGKTTANEDIWIVKLNPEVLAVSENLQKKIKIFPNPSGDFINIDSQEKFTKIEIYNISGQLLKTTNNTKIDISKFEKGNYIIKLYSEKKNASYQFIKK